MRPPPFPATQWPPPRKTRRWASESMPYRQWRATIPRRAHFRRQRPADRPSPRRCAKEWTRRRWRGHRSRRSVRSGVRKANLQPTSGVGRRERTNDGQGRGLTGERSAGRHHVGLGGVGCGSGESFMVGQKGGHDLHRGHGRAALLVIRRIVATPTNVITSANDVRTTKLGPARSRNELDEAVMSVEPA